ncbi:olfactory receptor 14C36-like [Hemicordylus capensis]|uniref:olfactory receptor 14C36-like n=1 Tax=Hemicordylus capensis TaxID=884348 RepID=UPI00230229D5|nr:olfactory receptor 14C36-like [Hemicordylus capensis]
MVNQTIVTEFFLQGFSNSRELQILHFAVFLSLYLATLMGNFLIIITIAQDNNLNAPMYFFLAILSSIDVCYISITVPNSMASSLMNDNQISYSGCIAQVFLVVTCATAELSLLTIMAYDRYVAICHPLQYTLIMNWNVCLQITAASFICSVINAVVHTVNTFQLHFCQSNIIEQYFCDIPRLLRISCTDTEANELLMVATAVCVGSFCFLFVFVSYGYIFSAVFKIQSDRGRYKVFSTCIPHLTVFCLFVFTLMFSYMRPKALSFPSVDLVAAVLYIILPPLLNPIIYSLRNQEIQRALWKMAKTRFGFHMVT